MVYISWNDHNNIKKLLNAEYHSINKFSQYQQLYTFNHWTKYRPTETTCRNRQTLTHLKDMGSSANWPYKPIELFLIYTNLINWLKIVYINVIINSRRPHKIKMIDNRGQSPKNKNKFAYIFYKLILRKFK